MGSSRIRQGGVMNPQERLRGGLFNANISKGNKEILNEVLFVYFDTVFC